MRIATVPTMLFLAIAVALVVVGAMGIYAGRWSLGAGAIGALSLCVGLLMLCLVWWVPFTDGR